MDPLLKYLRAQQNAMVAMLRQLVETESPSTDKAAVDRVGEIVAGIVRQMKGTVQLHKSSRTGNHLRAEFRFKSDKAARQILLLGHIDTVWSMSTIKQMPFRVGQGRAYGPGTYDMKAGIVIGLFAVQALQKMQVPLNKKVVLLLTADEEIGSPSSRAITEREGRHSDVVLVLESAHGPQGALKTARKGVGEFQIRVKGRAAHAGLEPEKGASAILELARQIQDVGKFAEPRKGITVNTGLISGGSRTNVIPAEATAMVDVRVMRRNDMARMERIFKSLKSHDRRTSIEVTGGFNRPPFERTAQVADLFQRARRVAKSLGIQLEETAVGGGSDGNFTAALGIPTLDGLGAVGDGAHALHEHIVIRELPRRAALLAHFIADL